MSKNRAFLLIILLITFVSFQNIFGQLHKLEHPDWAKNKSIYEVNIRQYTPEGTFDAFKEHLPRLKEMGIGILWLMPINPIGEENRKGGLGSYYSVKNYKKVNPEFGTKEDFRELVNEAHELGMYVIVDWVANHSAWDNVWTKTHPEFYNRDYNGNFTSPVDDWNDVIDFNYDNPLLWEYMLDALRYWVIEYNIDGYRCDVAVMVPTEFWNYARKELDKLKDVFMLAEAKAEELHHKAFDMTYNWHFMGVMNRIGKGEDDIQDLDEYFKWERKTFPQNDYRMNFTSNHDENSWKGTAFERLGESIYPFTVLTATMNGMPLVYSGQEAGLNERLEFFEKDTIEWKEHKLKELYTKLFHLKKKNKALWNGTEGGEMMRVDTGEDPHIFAFVREKGNSKVFTILNFSEKEKALTIKDKKIIGNYTELITGRKENFSNNAEFNLEPWDYKVFHK